MTDFLRCLLDFSPVFINIGSIISIMLLQFCLLLNPASSASATGFCCYLIERRINVIIQCIAFTVLTFIFYELFIWNWGTLISLVFMLASYYLLPVCSLVIFIVISIKLFSKDRYYLKEMIIHNYIFKSVISCVVCGMLFFIITDVAKLPCSVLCFALPFVPSAGIFVCRVCKH